MQVEPASYMFIVCKGLECTCISIHVCTREREREREREGGERERELESQRGGRNNIHYS